ncbi:MAG: DUF881 domain-containing protein [Actinomycetota bacterium]
MADTTSHDPQPAQSRRGGIALALAVTLLGFLLATQFRASQTLAGRLESEREEDLAQLLGDLQTQSDELFDEVVGLRIELDRARTSRDREQVLLDTASRQLASLRVLLGLVPVEGEGIEVTISDPDGTVGADILVDAVQELRDAGAEAIDVGGVRVVASTSFSGDPGAIRADRATRLSPPYRIKAIGGRQTLAEAMRIPGGVIDAVESQPGAAAMVTESPRLTIASLRPAPSFSYAEPA